jgi:hypothetical protein
MSRLAMIFLHTDCPLRLSEEQPPPRTVLEQEDDHVKVTCPACNAIWTATFEDVQAPTPVEA